jgi:hypothetical protein
MVGYMDDPSDINYPTFKNHRMIVDCNNTAQCIKPNSVTLVSNRIRRIFKVEYYLANFVIQLQ